MRKFQITYALLALAIGAPSSLRSQSPPPRAEPHNASQGESPIAASPDRVSPPAVNSAASDYILSKSDTIEMTIFREPDLNTRNRIASDGTVQLPLLGDVRIAGLTLRDARQLIRKLYNADYLVEPQVNLNVVDYAERQFTILGEVAKPGSYGFPGGKPLELLQAIGMAGGFTQYAGSVTIKRAGKGETSDTVKINAKKLATNKKESVQVLPDDVITVGSSFF